jgi:hypothetical protein
VASSGCTALSVGIGWRGITKKCTGACGLTLLVAGIADSGGYALLGIVLGGPIAAVGIIGAIIGVKTLSRGKRFGASKWKYQLNVPNP